MDNLIDIGLNLMHSSFRKDRVEIIEEAKKVASKIGRASCRERV